LNAKDVTGVVPKSDEKQSLIDTSVTQDGDTTTLTFTKIMVEDGEIPISIGANTFLGAWGSGNDLGIHAVRQSFDLDLVSGGVAELETRLKPYWKAHGWIAGITWGLLSPLAISASVLRKLFKGGLWFQIHRGLNMLVVVFTIIAFALAVVAINKETPTGASANHFSYSTNPHRTTGIVIFFIAIVQATLGIFRPHVPEKGEVKSTVRFIWEIVHRLLGFICLGLALYQVQSGIKIYQTIFTGSAESMLTVFWSVVGAIGGTVVLGLVSIRFCNIGNDEKMLPKNVEDNDQEVEHEQPSA
jgi:uncharacterized membrane protein YozB (DUF420 family)